MTTTQTTNQMRARDLWVGDIVQFALPLTVTKIGPDPTKPADTRLVNLKLQTQDASSEFSATFLAAELVEVAERSEELQDRINDVLAGSLYQGA